MYGMDEGAYPFKVRQFAYLVNAVDVGACWWDQEVSAHQRKLGVTYESNKDPPH